jgi:hypothetical protein
MSKKCFNSTTPTPNNTLSTKKGKLGLTIIAVALAIGLLGFTVFPHIALYLELITSEQYVTITTKFYESSGKVIENGLQVIPSILPLKR